MNRTVVAFLVIGVVAVTFIVFPGILSVFTPTTDECGAIPANAAVLTDQDIELALGESVAVFKGESRPEILDGFPKEARNAQMAAYMACKAASQGLITNAEELTAYLEAMKVFFETDRFPKRMSHEGPLTALADHVRKDPGQSWSLQVQAGLENFYLPEATGATPTEFMQKACSVSPCLLCTGLDDIDSGGIVRIELTEGSTLVDRTIDGVVRKVCGPN